MENDLVSAFSEYRGNIRKKSLTALLPGCDLRAEEGVLWVPPAAGEGVPLPRVPLAQARGPRLWREAAGDAGGAVLHGEDNLHQVKRMEFTQCYVMVPLLPLFPFSLILGTSLNKSSLAWE